MSYDYLVFIGRFEPFHNGHHAVISHALTIAKHVIVLIGSANKARTIRNPWNIAEREVMIHAAFAHDRERILIRPLRDHLYNDPLWVSDVQHAVASLVRPDLANPRIGLIGYPKDHSSYYLEMFPQWLFVPTANLGGVSATDLRDYLFTSHEPDAGRDLLIRAGVPEPVFAMLMSFRDGPHFAQLAREHQFVREYRKAWATAPYTPTFVTVDTVVIHSGHVLLIRRRHEPGKRLLALPGGFVDQHERLRHAAIRELREETCVELSDAALAAALCGREVFDHPERSLRGRTITHAFHFNFPAGELPRVTGSDDAERAEWLPISQALQMEEQFYDDHFHILEHFLGRA